MPILEIWTDGQRTQERRVEMPEASGTFRVELPNGQVVELSPGQRRRLGEYMVLLLPDSASSPADPPPLPPAPPARALSGADADGVDLAATLAHLARDASGPAGAPPAEGACGDQAGRRADPVPAVGSVPAAAASPQSSPPEFDLATYVTPPPTPKERMRGPGPGGADADGVAVGFELADLPGASPAEAAAPGGGQGVIPVPRSEPAGWPRTASGVSAVSRIRPRPAPRGVSGVWAVLAILFLVGLVGGGIYAFVLISGQRADARALSTRAAQARIEAGQSQRQAMLDRARLQRAQQEAEQQRRDADRAHRDISRLRTEYDRRIRLALQQNRDAVALKLQVAKLTSELAAERKKARTGSKEGTPTQPEVKGLRKLLYQNRLALADMLRAEGAMTRARELVLACEPEFRSWEWRRMDSLTRPPCHRVRARAPRSLATVAVTPDGRYIVTADSVRFLRVGGPPGDGDGKALLYMMEVKAGGTTRHMSSHAGGVSGVAVSPDGKLLASAGRSGGVMIWDAVTGKRLHTFPQAGAKVFGPGGPGVAFSPDSARVAGLDGDGMIRQWDTRTGQPVPDFGARGAASVTFLPGPQVLTARQGDLFLLDADTGKIRRQIPAHGGEVVCLAASADGTRAASCGSEGVIRTWDLTRGQALRTIAVRGHVTAVAVSSGGKLSAAAYVTSDGTDRIIRVWSTDTGKQVVTLWGHTGSVLALAFLPDGKSLVSVSSDTTIRIWPLEHPPLVAKLRGMTDSAEDLRYSSDGKILVVQNKDGLVVWDQKAVSPGKIHAPGKVGSPVSVGPHGRWIAAPTVARDDGGAAKTSRYTGLLLIDRLTGKERTIDNAALRGDSLPVQPVFHPRKAVLAFFRESRLGLLDPQTGEVTTSVPYLGASAKALAFCPDGTNLIVGDQRGLIRVYSVPDLRHLRTFLYGLGDAVCDLALSPDGRKLAAVGRSGTVGLFDLETGKRIWMLPGGTAPCPRVRFTPDGMRVITASGPVLHIRDAESGRLYVGLSAMVGTVRCFEVSPDGNRIVVGGTEDNVTLYDASPKEP